MKSERKENLREKLESVRECWQLKDQEETSLRLEKLGEEDRIRVQGKKGLNLLKLGKSERKLGSPGNLRAFLGCSNDDMSVLCKPQLLFKSMLCGYMMLEMART
ncbi:uncharacterized protein G2W53_033532 [Senna tora]|uniref:Uncharacterized protein n=1 Tax=Senna tora TaxID=362788 RepID=A0A834WB24_9FABA|nr:uncharacterized protein G2W53_033532 [Senna tora]